MRGRAVRAALAAAASGVWILAAAAPASAYVCAFGIDKPPTSGSTVVSLTGPFAVRQGSAERVLEVTFTSWPGGDAPPAVTRRGAAVGPADRYDVPVGGLIRNGTYKARVKASHAGTGIFNCADGLGQDQRDGERSGEVTFGVSVRALSPTNVQARFDAATRTATVTWDKSSDPDIAGYRITRKVGSEGPTAVEVPPEPRSWADDKLPSAAATVTYSVQAARVGPDPGTTSELSGAVAAAPLEVPAPPTPTTAPGSTGGTGATGTTVKAGAPPVAGTTPTTRPFVLGRPVGGAPPRAGNAELPSSDLNLPAGESPDDSVYRPLLPYPARDELDVDDGEIAADPAVVGRSEGPGSDGIPQLAYVASGLLSFVVAAHVLWLRKQVSAPEAAGAPLRSAPLEPLEPLESLETAPSPPQSPVPAPRELAPPPAKPADVVPPSAGASPFQPVILVDALQSRNARPGAIEDDGPARPGGATDARSDRGSRGGATGPARRPLRAPNRPRPAPAASAQVATAGRRPLRSPTRQPHAAPEAPRPPDPAATTDEVPPEPGEELRQHRTVPGAGRRPLRATRRSDDLPAAPGPRTAAEEDLAFRPTPAVALEERPVAAPAPPAAGANQADESGAVPERSATPKPILIIKRPR